jgi:hypothetical protein
MRSLLGKRREEGGPEEAAPRGWSRVRAGAPAVVPGAARWLRSSALGCRPPALQERAGRERLGLNHVRPTAFWPISVTMGVSFFFLLRPRAHGSESRLS